MVEHLEWLLGDKRVDEKDATMVVALVDEMVDALADTMVDASASSGVESLAG